MSIEEKIRSVAESEFQEFGFVLDDAAGVDVAVDKVELPAIVCYLVEDGTLTFKNGKVKDGEQVALAFIDKVERDADGMDNVQVFLSMKQVAEQFITVLNGCGFFEPVETVTYESLYEMLSANVSGLACYLTLKEAQGRCVL